MPPRYPTLLLVLLLGAAPFLSQAQNPSGQPRRKEDMRQPWARSEERFIRRWLVLSEIPFGAEADALAHDWLADTGGEASARPTPPAAPARGGPPRPATAPGAAPLSPPALQLAGGAALRWRVVNSSVDAIDLADGGGLKRNLVGYAFATVSRPEAGKARLCIGSDEGIRVWLNGALVLDRRGSRPLSYDEDQIELDFQAGDNALLVKLEQRAGPWTFSARVLESGAVPPRVQEIRPALLAASASALVVKTDLDPDRASEAPVLVQAVGAGGKVLATQTAARGATVRLDPSAWPAGAYEIRCETQKLNGARVAVHLPWFKGDALAAARQLVAAGASADASTVAGATIEMLARMVLDRLGGKIDGLPGDVWWAIHSPLLEWEELQLEAAGNANARKRAYGFYRMAWRDEIDGSQQYCRVYLPPGYTPEKKWPVVVRLHGMNPPNPDYINWWSADTRHWLADTEYGRNNEGIISLEPHGRGNTSYLGLGDQDIVRTIALAKSLFSVDADRVYLAGVSMGGFGTWYVGTRHPDLFAAIAPIYGSIEFRALASEEQLARLDPLDRFFQEKIGSWARAESLLHVPVFVLHGDADPTVSVETSRYGVRQLQRWGYDVRYFELPGYGHEDLQQYDRIFGWMLEHRRVTHPPRVRLRSAELQNASAYWAAIEQAERADRFMVLDAEIVGKNKIRVDTQNVLALSLSPGAPLIDPAKPVTLVWNGQTHTATATNGKLSLRAAAYDAAAPSQKNARVAGPIGDIFNTPFAIVVGTSSADESMNQVCRQKAAQLAAYWKSWQHASPRMFDDTEISDADAARYSLILIGGAEANLVARKLSARGAGGVLPLEFPSEPGTVKLGDRLFKGTDVRVLAIAPNPFNAQRYVLVIAGTSSAAFANFFPQTLRNAEFDFLVEEGGPPPRPVPGEAPRPMTAQRWIARGWFDYRWQIDDTQIFPVAPK